MISSVYSGALSLNLLPGGTSSGSSTPVAYAKGYGVIVGSDGIEYSHTTYAGQSGWETWRSDLGHSFVGENAAPADVLAIWAQQQQPSAPTPRPTSTSPVSPVIETATAFEGTIAVDTAPPGEVLNVDRAASDSPAPSSGAPNTGLLPSSGGTLTDAPASSPRAATINWRYVIVASLALAGVLWFFGARRRKGGN